MNQREAFHVLASADRQLVLHELLEQDGEASVEELARQVAARRHRIPPATIADRKIERAQVRLVHNHFPRLADRDVVDIDWNERTVTLTEGESVDSLFDAAEEIGNWPPDDLLHRPSP